MTDQATAAPTAGDFMYRKLVQSITDYAIYMLAPDGTVANWNAGAERAKGYRAADIVGRHFSCFYSAEDCAAGLPQRSLETALACGRFEAEGWRLRKDGSRFWASVVIDPIYDDGGMLLGFAKITRDITEKMEAAARLQQAAANLDLALRHMANALCLYDKDERLVLHNSRLHEIFGLPADMVLQGRSFAEILALIAPFSSFGDGFGDELYRYHRQLVDQPDGGVSVRVLANGKTVRIAHMPTGDGGWVTTLEDITERQRSEARIAHMARHDGLTGLPNRGQFIEKLEAALHIADRGLGRVAAIGIDLDRFKDINDSFGHAAGDAVLTIVAERLSALLQEGEAVARFGGDEFAALKVFSDDPALQDFIVRLRRELTTPIDLGHAEVTLGASIGVAVYPTDAADREKLLNNADLAMYRAKESLGEDTCFYQPDMDEAARARRALARDLWAGMERGEFFLNYQEQRDAETQAITGYEVLLRWRHPQHGLVPPAVFIPIAEECGAIGPLGDWVLEAACREATQQQLPHRIAVNLSALQLTNVGLVDRVRAILLATGLAPTRLELEVTESAIIGDKARALHILRQLKAMGISIAIDDFGTGYSSLETLRAFPFDKIKLDRSFTNELESNRQSKAFVRAILALGRSLNVSVLAEGVETEQQMKFLREEGCNEVQGYLFGRPDTLARLGIGGAAPAPEMARAG